jgi:subtilisin-like proprotein convertase family protein
MPPKNIDYVVKPKAPYFQNSNCDYTSRFNGTSAAAPTISGIIALMLSANKALTWRDIRYLLANSAVKIDKNKEAITISGNIVEYPWITNSAGYSFHNWYGFGKPDGAKAIKLAKDFTANNLGVFKKSDIQIKDISYNIADNDYNNGANSTIKITTEQVKHIEGLNIIVDITHAQMPDLMIELISPSGTKSILLNPYSALKSKNGRMSEYTLSSNAFYGESSVGTWTLKVRDLASRDIGSLDKWGIVFFGSESKIDKL